FSLRASVTRGSSREEPDGERGETGGCRKLERASCRILLQGGAAVQWDLWQCRHQSAGVLMLRTGKNLFSGSTLHDFALMKNGNAVANSRHGGQIVRNVKRSEE